MNTSPSFKIFCKPSGSSTISFSIWASFKVALYGLFRSTLYKPICGGDCEGLAKWCLLLTWIRFTLVRIIRAFLMTQIGTITNYGQSIRLEIVQFARNGRSLVYEFLSRESIYSEFIRQYILLKCIQNCIAIKGQPFVRSLCLKWTQSSDGSNFLISSWKGTLQSLAWSDDFLVPK